MPYKVLVDDNFHYMDESERYELAEFESWEAAATASKRIVDEFLNSAFRPGMTAQELYKAYIGFGEDPFIVSDDAADDSRRFSAWSYAQRRCAQICQPDPCLTQYKNLARQHWKEFLPKRYAELKQAGELDPAVTRAAELTDQEMAAAVDAGIPLDQAWEGIKGHYLLLKPEPEEPDEDDNPNRAFWLLSRAIHQEAQLVLEGKLDVAARVAELNNEERYEEATKLYHQSAD